jgi:hypothetical protein
MPPKDQKEWNDFKSQALMLVDAGAIGALNDQLYAACVTCHEQYRPNYGKGRLKDISFRSRGSCEADCSRLRLSRRV